MLPGTNYSALATAIIEGAMRFAVIVGGALQHPLLPGTESVGPPPLLNVQRMLRKFFGFHVTWHQLFRSGTTLSTHPFRGKKPSEPGNFANRPPAGGTRELRIKGPPLLPGTNQSAAIALATAIIEGGM